jgi:hypothetical protein
LSGENTLEEICPPAKPSHCPSRFSSDSPKRAWLEKGWLQTTSAKRSARKVPSSLVASAGWSVGFSSDAQDLRRSKYHLAEPQSIKKQVAFRGLTSGKGGAVHDVSRALPYVRRA